MTAPTMMNVQSTVPEAPSFDASCAALRRLDLEHPRVYAVANMREQGKRRWWALADGTRAGRFAAMYRRALLDHPDEVVAARQVATSLIHAIVGRVAALLALENRAFDPGAENLWLHLDSDVGIDWVGLTDTRIRVALPVGGGAKSAQFVTLPCDDALTTWLAHRCATSLSVVLDALTDLAGVDEAWFWKAVGNCVAGAASFVPSRTGTDATAAWDRGQRFLDAFVSLGFPVRSGSRSIGRTQFY